MEWHMLTLSIAAFWQCVVAPSPTPPVIGKCPDETWLDTEGNYCYKYMNGALTWNDANNNCLAMDSNMTSIHSEDENVLLPNFIEGSDIWLGLIQKSNGLLGWSDGTPYNYEHWSEGEPNSDEEKCTEMYFNGATWNDIDCSTHHYYVCKTTKSTVVAPSPTPPVIGQCPDDTWIDAEGNYCYKYMEEELTWDGANSNCLYMDSNMSSIHSEEDNTLLQDFMKDRVIWLGLVQKSSDLLGWSDRTPYNYSHWKEGEPNSDEEKCTEMYENDGTWNDIDCSIDHPYFCKTPKIYDYGSTHAPTTYAPIETTTQEGGRHFDEGLLALFVLLVLLLALVLVLIVLLLIYLIRGRGEQPLIKPAI